MASDEGESFAAFMASSESKIRENDKLREADLLMVRDSGKASKRIAKMEERHAEEVGRLKSENRRAKAQLKEKEAELIVVRREKASVVGGYCK